MHPRQGLPGMRNDMIINVFSCLVGFAAGCLLTMCIYESRERKRAARRRENQQKKREQERQAQRAALLEEQRIRARQKKNQQARQAARSIPKADHPPVQKSEEAPAEAPAKPKAVGRPLQEAVREFQSVQTLKLEFRSSTPLPEFNPFTPGEGYLRDRENRVIPQPERFQTLNTGRGYAEQGILWAFDAVYQGKCYSFERVLGSPLADRYFRLTAIIAPAVVELQAGYNIYYLKAKGKLEIADP